METPHVSILVLNYNGIRFLKDCFDTLFASNYPNYEVVLVDNNSSDNSVPFTKKNYKQIQIIQTGANAGYSRAYNIAIKQNNADYYIFLNNDVKVDKNWLEPLVNRAEEDKNIAALQPKIRSLIDEGYFEYAGSSGGLLDKYGYPFLRGRIFYHIEYDNNQYDDECDIFWASGAALFIRSNVLKKTNLLDEDFVHHMEEIDLCWRIHLHGYKIKVIPQSTIFHYAGATIKAESFKKLYWNHRNGLFMLLKNYSLKSLIKIMPPRILLDYLNTIYAFLKLDFKHVYAIVKSHLWILLHLKLILQKRKDVQEHRKVNDVQIKDKFFRRSIILQYFIFKKKTFTDLNM